MDTLTVKGIGKTVDGVYECDIAGMIADVTSAEALTVDEANLVKRLSGVRGFELGEAFLAGDASMRMALAMIVVARGNKTLDEDRVRRAPMGALLFEWGSDPDDVEHPTVEVGAEGTPPSPSGGESSRTTSGVPPENEDTPTGAPV